MPEQESASTEGGLRGFFDEHRTPIVVIGLIASAIAIYVFIRGRGATSTNTANSPASSQQTLGGTAGSLGNAGYQDSGTAYALTQLGQQLNNLQATLSATPPPTVPTPTPTPTPPPTTGQGIIHSIAPLLPAGSTIKAGRQGRIWGVTPAGKDVLLFSTWGTPQGSALLPRGTKLVQGGFGRWWYVEPGQAEQALIPTNPQAAHSPIQSFLPLVRGANENVDLSNYTVSTNFGLTKVPSPGVGMWNGGR